MNHGPRTTNHKKAGFTLVELMVAVAVTTVLILAINSIFSNVSAGVSTGIANSDILAKNRIIAKQLQGDFDEMVGPLENGILIIVNQRIGEPNNPNDGVLVLAEDDQNENGNTDVGDITRDARIDQLVFIRHRGDAEPLVPGNANSFSNSTDAMYAKVWYGHCRRTAPDGSMNQIGRLGAKDTTPGAGLGINQLAGDWILGRQALFLSMAPSTFNARALGAYADGDVSIPSPWNVPAGLDKLYMGVSDIAQSGLSAEDARNPKTAIVGGKKPTTTSDNYRLWLDLDAKSYAELALTHAYVDFNGTVNGESRDVKRLWCNPAPQYNPADSDYQYGSWQIAQMHPYLAGNVSDFVVEFAGDYTDQRINPTSITPGNPISGKPNGILDTYNDGSIIWYGLDITPPTSAFLTKDSTGKNQKPIRGQYTSTGISRDVRYVFRHGPGGTNWPYMIRIRYRVLDHRGKALDTTGEPGRWFEMVLPVNRTGSTFVPQFIP